jgi:hypothetical protein
MGYREEKQKYPKDYWSKKSKAYYARKKNDPEWYAKHKERSKKARKPGYMNAYNKKRKLQDPNYRLILNLRKRLNIALKNNSKQGSAVKDLGCTIPEFKIHLESKFQPGMTWENYGRTGWHIDHIKPLASFDLNNRENLIQACHYTNLQPLWAEDNISKGKRT